MSSREINDKEISVKIHLSENHKKKLSESNKGKHQHLFGRKVSKETRKKIGDSNRIVLKEKFRTDSEYRNVMILRGRGLRKYFTEEVEERRAKNAGLSQVGKVISENTKEKLRIANLGRRDSEETIMKRSKSLKRTYMEGRIPYMKGRHHTQETKQKLRDIRLKQVFPQKNSKPEIKTQNGLKGVGIEFETHKPIIGQPDLFIKPNVCIFVDGCYFHGCEKCYNKNKMSSWIRATMVRDLIVTLKLQRSGYKVLRFWEHDINKNFEDKILDEIIFTCKEIKNA